MPGVAMPIGPLDRHRTYWTASQFYTQLIMQWKHVRLMLRRIPSDLQSGGRIGDLGFQCFTVEKRS